MPTPKKQVSKKPAPKTPRSKKNGGGLGLGLFGQTTITTKNYEPVDPSMSGALLSHVRIEVDPMKKYKYTTAGQPPTIENISADEDEKRLKIFYEEICKYASERPIKESGCLSYNVVRDGHNFHFYELYENEDAQKKHGEAPNIQEFRDLKTAAGFSWTCTKVIKKYWVIEKVVPPPLPK